MHFSLMHSKPIISYFQLSRFDPFPSTILAFMYFFDRTVIESLVGRLRLDSISPTKEYFLLLSFFFHCKAAFLKLDVLIQAAVTIILFHPLPIHNTFHFQKVLTEDLPYFLAFLIH